MHSTLAGVLPAGRSAGCLLVLEGTGLLEHTVVLVLWLIHWCLLLCEHSILAVVGLAGWPPVALLVLVVAVSPGHLGLGCSVGSCVVGCPGGCGVSRAPVVGDMVGR